MVSEHIVLIHILFKLCGIFLPHAFLLTIFRVLLIKAE